LDLVLVVVLSALENIGSLLLKRSQLPSSELRIETSEQGGNVLQRFFSHGSSLGDYVILVLLEKIQESGNYLSVISIMSEFLEFSEDDSNGDHSLWEANHA
jgi:hypothetical protein